MKKFISALAIAAVFAGFVPSFVHAESAVTRLKDVSKVQGVRSNQLMGYGLVVGLNGTGDSNKTTETINSVVNMLRSYGITVSSASLKPKNVAAVMVTATLPPFAREGDTLDVTVSSVGDAKSVQGGTLIQTPLRAGNGGVYAVAQGAVSTGGFMAGNGGNNVQKNFPTVGLSPNGAIVEKTVEDNLGDNGTISLSLTKSDFTTASRVAAAVNSRYGRIAKAANPGRVDINIPRRYQNNVVDFVASIEELPITPDSVARVVLNERTGTIVMGGNVTVDECAITQGGISINVTSSEDAVVAPYTLGNGVKVNNTDVEVQEEKARTIVVPPSTSINDIVGALNTIGATPRDIISIIQAMKAAGAIHADVEII